MRPWLEILFEKTSFILRLVTLSVSNHKHESDDFGKTGYYIEFSLNTSEEQKEETDDIDVNEITNKLEEIQITTPSQFNTFDKIDDCLDQLSSKLNILW